LLCRESGAILLPRRSASRHVRVVVGGRLRVAPFFGAARAVALQRAAHLLFELIVFARAVFSASTFHQCASFESADNLPERDHCGYPRSETSNHATVTSAGGTSESLIDGPLVAAYTINNLQPTNITIPGYAPRGKLYQANITARSDGGTVTPLISDFNARAADGTTYRVIDTVATPNGISPAPTNQGHHSDGKIYFDVTGPTAERRRVQRRSGRRADLDV
jgi:hypothetical protein